MVLGGDQFDQDRANAIGRGEGELVTPRGFVEMLEARQRSANSLLCVGLDPDLGKIPSAFREHWSRRDEGSDNHKNAVIVGEFAKTIVTFTHDLVSAWKPNIAFLERYGADGLHELKGLIDYAREVDPTIPVILDAKRADIGATNKGYADMVKYLGADALTVNPYFGIEGKGALGPFLELGDMGVIILCRTSNSEAGEIQDEILQKTGEPLYMKIARMAEEARQHNPNVAIVVGATFPEQLRKAREIFKGQILVPGLGKQGGRPEDLAGVFVDGGGIIANNATAIIHASQGEDFAEAARAAALQWRDAINGAKDLPMPEGPSRKEKLVKRQERTLQILQEVGAFDTGHFLLKSGKHSGEYVRKDRVYLDGEATEEICRMMAEDLVGHEIDVVAGPVVGGAILSQEVAKILGRLEGRRVLSVFADKVPNGDGGEELVLKRGFDEVVDKARVATVEDVITTGGSVIETNEAIRLAGGKVVDVVAMANRSGGKVTAETLGVPTLSNLANMNIPTFEPGPENCPHCAADVPLNNNVGHGAQAKLSHP